ncbi:MAG: TSUP family transporter [Elusimicrobium sp.]|jgi:uncharacterized membrane protein YfcA|nr:TSUP family transporter [Elusimicrobium sp.]
MNYVYLGLMLFAAGFVDSLAGGGGLITLPSYMAFGLSPALLLGTNKLSSCMGTAVAAWKFRHQIKLDKKLLAVISVLALFFSAAGALLSRVIHPSNLKILIIIVIPFVAYFVIMHKKFQSVKEKYTAAQKNRAAKIISSSVALYDGFLGPGAGTMYASFLTRFCGYDIVQATAVAKVLNLCSNIFAFVVFISLGAVDIKLGFMMGLFNILGARLGVAVGKRRGGVIIRPLIILVCIAILIKYIYEFAVR